MARNFVNSTANYLRVMDVTNSFSQPVIPTTPTTYTISGWLRPTTLGLDATLYSQADGTAGNGAMLIGLSSANKGLFLSKAAGITATDALTSTTASINAWHHVCGVQSSLTLRTVYLDGGGAGTSTTSQSPGTTNATIGVLWFGGGSLFRPAAGDIAEVAVWSVALDANEVLSLSQGASSLLIRPSALLGYWPLMGYSSPEITPRVGVDAFVNLGMRLVGTAAQAAHPRVLYPRRRVLGRHAAAAISGPVVGSRVVQGVSTSGMIRSAG